MGDTVLLNWEAAYDQFTPQNNLSYLVYVSSSPGQQNFSQPVKIITSGELSSFLSSNDTSLITAGATLYFVVRAQNSEGLIDDNRAELSVTLSPPSSIAYVSKTSDGTGTLGDPFDPYLTIQSAINSVVSNGGGSIFVDAALNGTLYNEELDFINAVSYISLFGGFNRFSSLPPQPSGLDVLKLRDLLAYPTTIVGPGLPYTDGDLIRIVNNGSPTTIDGFTIDGQNACSNEIRAIDAHFQLSGSVLDQDTCLFADTTVVTTGSILRIVGNRVFGQNSHAFSVGGGINTLYVQNNNVRERGRALDSANTATQDFKVLSTGTNLLISHNTLISGSEALDLRFSPAVPSSGGPLDVEISRNEIRDFGSVARVLDYAEVGDNGKATLTILNNLFLGSNLGFEIDMIDGDPHTNVDASLLWQYNVLQNTTAFIGLDINDVIVSANRTTTLSILDSLFANSESEIIEITDADPPTDNVADGGQIYLDVRRNSFFSGEDFEIELGTPHGGLTKITVVENAILGSEDEAINFDIEPYLGNSNVMRTFPDGLVLLSIFNNDFHGGDEESFELLDDRGSDQSAAFVYVGHNYLADSPDPSSEVGVDFDTFANNGSFLFERNFIGIGGQDPDSAFEFETGNDSLNNFFRLQNNVITLANGTGIKTNEAGGQLQIINNTVAYNGDKDRFGISYDGISLGENAQTFIANSIISHHAEADLQPGYESSYSLIRDGLNGLGFGSISGEPIYLKEPADLPFPISVGANLKDLFTLAPTSPAINAGNPLDRFNDPDGSRNDMGAYGGPAAGAIGFGAGGREIPLVWIGVLPAVDLFTGAGLIANTSAITLAFTRPVSLSSLSNGIVVTSDGNNVPGSFSTSNQGYLVTFTPTTNLTPTGFPFVQFSLNKNLKTIDGQVLAYITNIRIPVKPTAIAEIEANDTVMTAQQLPFGPSTDTIVVTGSAANNMDQDFYSFTANAGDRLMVSIFDSRTTLVTNGSYQVQLLDSLSTVIKEGTIDAFNSDPYLDTVIKTTGTYFLQVSNPGIMGSTTYEIQAVLD